MRRIRKVYLQNAAGDRWGLNGENGVYVSSLAGFGYTLSPTYADHLTRGFFLAVSGESEPQGTVPFTVYFTRNAYAVYQSFVDWLAAAGTVILCYNPTGDQEYRRDVDVNFLQKGELNEVGWLEVPSSFYVKTPWYKPYATTLSLETAGGDSSKRYDYVYDSSFNVRRRQLRLSGGGASRRRAYPRVSGTELLRRNHQPQNQNGRQPQRQDLRHLLRYGSSDCL